MRPAVVAAIAATVILQGGIVLGACGVDQDPGVDVRPGAPATTSVTLGPCPLAGPDTTTPAAGCLDDSGRVLRG